MSQKLESAIAVIGIDIGKNSFHIVGLDDRGAIVLRQKWSRGQVETRFANMPRCLIGMEACVGAHHLSRKLNSLGHDARLMPAKYVRPYSKGQKNDFRDAEAIAEAVQRPTMKFVATKTADQLDLQALHRIRERLVSQRTGIINQIRAFLLERGVAVRQGLRFLRAELPNILATPPDVLSPRMVRIIEDLACDWRRLDKRVEGLSNEIEAIARRDAGCERLMSVPGIGPIISSAIVAAIGAGDVFTKGAQEARLVAEQTRADQIKFPADLLARRDVAETDMAIRDQERQFRERKQSLDGQIGILTAQIEQKQQDTIGRTRQRDSLASQMASFKTEMTTVFPLVAKGFYARNKYLALERDSQRVEGEFGLAESDILRFGKAIEEAKLQIKQTRFKFDDEVSTALNDIRAKISDAPEKIVMAEDVLTRVDVRAPRSGTVLGLKVHGVGAVVEPGETLAEIVPLGEGLLVTARVQPNDIESVEVGQTAEVRFANFSSRQTSVILGKVISVAPDATVDQTGNQQQQQPYFAAKIVIDYSAVPENIAKKIQPGMQADVMISTGERTALNYFIGPLKSSFAKTFREK